MRKINLFKHVGLILILLAATFLITGCGEEPEVKLEVDPEGAGNVTVERSLEEREEKATLTAEAEEGYEFLEWRTNGEVLSTDKVYEFIIKESMEITAVFIEIDEEFHQEVLGLAEEAISVYFGHVNPNNFTGNAQNELEKGNLRIAYPGVNFFNEYVETDFDVRVRGEEEAEVTASIKYHHIDNSDFEKLREEVKAGILEEADKGPVDLTETFSQVLTDNDLSQRETVKNLIIRRIDGELRVVEIDAPGELFSSFDELYREAVADRIDEVLVKIDDGVFGGDGVFEPVTAKYNGTEIEIFRPAIDPVYLLNETKVISSEGLEIPLENIWKELVLQVDYEPFLNFGPENYFDRIEFRDIESRDEQSLYLTRPYAVLTMESAIGYIDTETGEVNLFNKITGPGGGVSDFHWSPNDKYLSYYYMESGSGHNYLDVYDISNDEVIKVNEIAEFVDYHNVEHGFIGNFKNLQWSDDGNTLFFDSEIVECLQDEDDPKTSATSWSFDVEERRLVLR